MFEISSFKNPQLIGVSEQNIPVSFELSTNVEELMWISVDNLIINKLVNFCVNSLCINKGTYTQLIHIIQSGLKACNQWLQKIKLDRLSTYSQSLLLILIIKINLK